MYSIVRLLAVAGAVCSVIAVPAVSAAASPNGGIGDTVVTSAAGLHDAGIPALPAPNCPAGQRPVSASAAGKLPGGGFAYDFVISGQVNQYRVPPASFRPTTASAAELAEYGFQPRPAGSAALASWMKTFGDYRGVPLPRVCVSTKYNLPASHRPDYIPGNPTSPNEANDLTNWAGVAAYNASHWVAVQGDWPQSSAGACGCGTSDTDESTWSGLGGYNTSALLQQGTDMSGTPSTITPWYEYLHACPASNPNCNVPELPINNLTVAANDSVHTYTAYQTSDNQANFLVCAEGNCQSIVMTLDSSYYDGTYAEDVDERPCYPNSDGTCAYKALTNFYYNDWTNSLAETTGGTWEGLESVNSWAISMTNDSGQALVSPGSFGSSSFRDTWHQAT